LLSFELDARLWRPPAWGDRPLATRSPTRKPANHCLHMRLIEQPLRQGARCRLEKIKRSA